MTRHFPLIDLRDVDSDEVWRCGDAATRMHVSNAAEQRATSSTAQRTAGLYPRNGEEMQTASSFGANDARSFSVKSTVLGSPLPVPAGPCRPQFPGRSQMSCLGLFQHFLLSLVHSCTLAHLLFTVHYTLYTTHTHHPGRYRCHSHNYTFQKSTRRRLSSFFHTRARVNKVGIGGRVFGSR